MPSALERPRVTHILLCEAHASQAGKNSYLGVFDRVFAAKFPAQHPCAVVVAAVHGPPGESQDLWIRYCDSQGDDVIPPLGPFKVTYSNYGTANLHLQINGLPIRKAGIFTIGLEHDGTTVGSTELYVEPQPQDRP